MSEQSHPYPEVPVRADYPAIERRILDFWRQDDTFQASIDFRSGADPYLFNDGPPFANGLPHYGHLLTGYVKDIVPRYQTMRGRRVERRFGWDCHGLPAEMESEKELGVSGRRAITEYGIDRFNEHCRTSVLRYTSEWEAYVTRQARWVDFENEYKTMDLSYMESVLWAFRQLWDKGLLYEAFRVMPYSWGAQTPLSNFEIRLDDATRPRQDPALTIAFDLDPLPTDPNGVTTKILAWTTTPWTLPSNLALAVGPDLQYSVYEQGEVRYVVGAGAAGRYEKELEGASLVASGLGADLVGRTYQPLFPYFAGHPHAFRVLAGDFIDDAEGTGVVHMAPGFGEDDQRVCEANGIELVVPVDDEGNFTAEIEGWAGVNVFEANAGIIRWLKDAGRVLRHDSYTHNYPHCWRTDTPIIYRAMSSWYVEVTAIKDRLQATNQEINWIPGHVRDGAFGKWLEGARDWSISRNRFWGAPIPVWRSDDPEFPRVDVYGSIADLERDFGVAVTDLHRPFVDNLVRPNPDDPSGRSMMRRVPEVLDCWFESGSMPFAQAHYPFEKGHELAVPPPADFIVEYIAQTRGWFYTMHVLSVALFDRAAFGNCICHGVVLDEDGRKLSKRLRNYPDPEDVFERIGSDALRWFLVSSPILRGGDLKIDREGSGIQDSVRLVLNPIWNTWHFFTLYSNVEGYQAEWRVDSPDLLDRYILAKSRELVLAVQDSLDRYEIADACSHLIGFLDAFTNWYIRRSRDRFWGTAALGDAADRTPFDTLFTVLHVLTRVAAPLLPLLCEDVYQGLTGERSVHLADWPDAESLPADPALVAAMDKVRDVCSAGLSLRETQGLRVRLPLPTLVVAGRAAELVAPFADLIKDELNVRAIEFTDDVAGVATFVLRPNGKLLGPKLGADVQKVMKAAREGAWSSQSDGTVTVAGYSLLAEEFELALQARAGEATIALRGNDTVVNLDVNVTPELAAEGVTRDLVRLVQQSRKDADLHVAERIRLTLCLPDAVLHAVQAHQPALAEATLATEIVLSPVALSIVHNLEGHEISFAIDVLR